MKLPHYIKITSDTEYGDSKFCGIRLNPEYKNDKGLIAHEYTHIKQWYAGLAVGLIITLLAYLASGRADYTFYTLMLAPFWKELGYTFIKPCRLFLELQAFAVQISIEPKEHQGAYVRAYAKSLADNYNLSITKEEAEQRLKSRLN